MSAQDAVAKLGVKKYNDECMYVLISFFRDNY